MNDITLNMMASVVKSKLLQWSGSSQSKDTIQKYLIIVSNLLEYIEHDQI